MVFIAFGTFSKGICLIVGIQETLIALEHNIRAAIGEIRTQVLEIVVESDHYILIGRIFSQDLAKMNPQVAGKSPDITMYISY